MKKLFLAYLVRFLIGAIALGIGIWYVSSSIDDSPITYTSMDSFLRSIGAPDGNIGSANGCFLCVYIKDLFDVLNDAAESFWATILDNLWLLMVIGFGIFFVLHTIKYFYTAMTDTVSAIGGKIGDGASGGSGGSSKSSKASSSSSNGGASSTGKSSSGDSGGTNSSAVGGFAPGGGTSSTKPDRYRYAQLEWLAVNGGAHFLTNNRPTDATGIKIKFNQSVSGDQSVVWLELLKNKWFGVHVAGTLFLPFGEDWSEGDVGVNVATNSDYEVSINYMNDRKRYVNGVSRLDITNTLNYPSAAVIRLFDNSGTHSAKFHGRVYYMKITEGKSLVTDMVPARIIVEGEPKGAIGMYDLVSHEFQPNIDGGEITAGPIVGYLEKIQGS